MVPACSIFINKVVDFLGVGLSLYALAGLYQYISRDPILKRTVKCKYCRKRISEKVSHMPRGPCNSGASLSRLTPKARPNAVSTARVGRMAEKRGWQDRSY